MLSRERTEAYDGAGGRCGIQPLVDNRVTGVAVDKSFVGMNDDA